MGEFNLVSQASIKTGTTVPFTSRAVSGQFKVSALEIKVNEPVAPLPWPSSSEIPGLIQLEEQGGSNPFQLTTLDGKVTILWNNKLLLTSDGLPQLVRVGVEELKGLKVCPGDSLPSEFNSAIHWSWLLEEENFFYGLGQRSCSLERRGTAPVNWTTDEPSGHNRATDPLYQAHPLLWGRTGAIWWAVLMLHSPYSRFDLGQEQYDRMQWLSLGSALRLQIHAGYTPKDLYKSLSQVWAAPTTPPLWALGFHQSRWGYKSGQEVLDLVNEFRQRELPLDVVHLDIDHMEGYRSFTFSQQRFPEAKELIKNLQHQEVKIVTIIDPGLKFDPANGYEPCDSGMAGNYFLKSPSGAPLIGYCWPDEALFPDFSRQATRNWWAKLAKFYLNHGVSGLWIDMNEPAIFDKPFWAGGHQQSPLPLDTPGGEDGRRFGHAALHNLYGSHMAWATSETWSQSDRRPWVLTRSGFTGVGAYAWSWMGDNTSWWEHLQLSLPQLASMGLVGCPFVGVDIGGFFGHCTPELYSAWIEASVIYPFMRAHSALGTRTAHPWSFGSQVETVARTALGLRYRLLPYLYASSIAQTRREVPILRPMFFDYPDDRRFEQTEDQVMFGPHLMAAPFLKPGQAERLVLLPQGQWYELLSGLVYAGNQSIVIERNPGLTPLFARAGSIIPLLSKNITSSEQAQQAEWSLLAFPGPTNVWSSLYWDSGDGYGFREENFWEVTLRQRNGSPHVIEKKGKLAGPKLNVYAADGGGRWTELGVLF